MAETPSFPFVDVALSRRLERAEAQSNIDFVEARARAFPDSRARHIEIAGAHAMFDGVDSPLTQTFGLGMKGPISEADMERIETFYRDLGAPTLHEVSPLADPTSLALLTGRGFEPFEFSSVMFQPLGPERPRTAGQAGPVGAREARPGESELWADTFLRGWGETKEIAEFMATFSRVAAQKTSGRSFLAELDGRPIAAAGLSIHEGVALLAGASTIPEGRRQGAQNALLEERLAFAARNGCDLAMMCALPGSSSQRNAERHGFRIAYTRIKWRRAVTYTGPSAS